MWEEADIEIPAGIIGVRVIRTWTCTWTSVVVLRTKVESKCPWRHFLRQNKQGVEVNKIKEMG